VVLVWSWKRIQGEWLIGPRPTLSGEEYLGGVGTTVPRKQETRTGSSWVVVIHCTEIRDPQEVRWCGKGDCVEDWMGDTLDVISKTWNYGTAVRSQERDCKVMHCHLLTIVSHLLRLEV
jgi:hypothetical protein